MTKKVLVLFTRHVHSEGRTPYVNHVPLLQAAHNEAGIPTIDYSYGLLRELIFVYDGRKLAIREPRTGKDIASFDLVFFQKWFTAPQQAYAAALYLQHQKTPFFADEVLHQNPVTKLGELPLITQAGLPYPKTIVAPLAAYPDLLDDMTMPFTYPAVLKSAEGTRGEHNYLVRNRAEMEQLVEQYRDNADHETFMAQEFLANDGDYRITIMGGEIAYIMHRTSQEGSHLNNTSQGGKAVFLRPDELPESILHDARKAAKVAHREAFAGVDILIGKDKKRHWVLEVNKSPEIQTGFNSAFKTKLLDEYIRRRLV